jgi:PAS domain S-box-containing protein
MLGNITELLQVVVDTAVDGVILIDAGGSVLLFNPACERLFGYTPTEAVGQNVKMLMPPDFSREHDNYLANYRRTGERKIIGVGREVIGQRKDGTTFPMELSVGETTQAGEPLYVGIVHDITERKHAEEMRQLFIEQLMASNEERGHFAYVASHDLQEHLRMVLSFGTLFSEEYGPQLDDTARKYLSLSLNAAAQMRELVDDLVEYGRLGTEKDRMQEFEAMAEIGLVLEVLKESIKDARAEIEVERLPVLFGNPVRFRRLMQNLVGNAIKYREPNVRPVVRIASRDEGNFWRFSVTDNGIGIDPAYAEKIFDPFRRLHTKAQYAGTGLGLAICKTIVAGFGGRIWVESKPGAGSTFCFTIRKKDSDQ